MSGVQGDLFVWAQTARPRQGAAKVAVRDLSDAALAAAIPDAGVDDYADLVAEAARRRLATAVPALAALCRRFAGFGCDRVVREQVAALNTLAAIGGKEAAAEVARLLERSVIEGPGVAAAANAAAQLGSRLPPAVLTPLFDHASPAVRADACRCVHEVSMMPLLVARLDDPERRVRNAAACALGSLGSPLALPALTEMLRHAPSIEAIEAAALVADEACMVLLGRIAREQPRLRDAALDALDGLADARADRIAATVRLPARP